MHHRGVSEEAVLDAISTGAILRPPLSQFGYEGVALHRPLRALPAGPFVRPMHVPDIQSLHALPAGSESSTNVPPHPHPLRFAAGALTDPSTR